MKVKTQLMILFAVAVTLCSKAQVTSIYSMNLDKAMVEAVNLARNQQYAKAKMLCARIVQQAPKYYDAWLLLGNINAWEGNYDEARLFTSRLLKDSASYVPAWILLGNTYAWEDHYEEAKSTYFTVFEYDNANKAAFLGLINLEISNNHPQSAVEICQSALEFYPTDPDILLVTAKASAMAGDMIAAKKSLLLILTKDQANEEARDLYQELTRSVTLTYTRPGIAGDSKAYDIVDIDTLMTSARQLAWDGKYGEARFLTNQILTYRPEYFPALVLNAYTYAWGNDFQNARIELDKIHVEENGYRDGILAWMDTEKWARNYDNAIGFADMGLKFYPDDKEFLLKKSQILGEKGDYLQAKRVIYSYILNHGQDPEMLQAYTALLADSNATTLAKGANRNDLPGVDIGIDSLFNEAQRYTDIKYYNEALGILEVILEAQPNNFDARFLKANIFNRQGAYSQSSVILEDLYSNVFDSYDLILSLVDARIGLRSLPAALELINSGLLLFPNDPDLLLKKAGVMQLSGSILEANDILYQVLAIRPNDPVAKRALMSLKGPLHITGISGEYTHNRFTIPTNRFWNMYTMRYYHSVDAGTFIGSVNMGYINTGNTPFMQGGGVQFEIDAYPTVVAKKRYFHINYGFSPSSVFARHRFGAHIYNEIPKNLELSAGFNYMFFKGTVSNVNTFIMDAGISKFFDLSMLTFRINVSPYLSKFATGYTLIFRRYLSNSKANFLQLAVGTGLIPDNPTWYINDPTYVPNQLLNSLNFFGMIQYRLATRWIGRLTAGFAYEEYVQRKFRNNTTLNVALIYLLKDY